MDFDDIVKIVDQVKVLEARLAVVEAERDAAQKRVQECETRMMRYAIQLGEMQAERDAARAGEARAVEALRRCHEGAARQLAEPRDHDDDQYALTAIATDCEAALADSAIALDWLAHQRREAAAEALEEFAYDADGIEELIACNIFDLRSALRARAAALRTGEVGND